MPFPTSFLWLLQLDLNNRHNVLTEEYRFLQESVLSITEEINISTLKREVADGIFLHDMQAWKTSKATERELITLYSSLVKLQTALNKSKTDADISFAQALEPRTANDAIFWYLSSRSTLINQVFEHCADRLRIAYTELAQAIDNFSGQLPQPLLMRRWNSNMYAEFLSLYSRHLNWQCQRFMAIACNNNADKQHDVLKAVMQRTHSSHSWGHRSASKTKIDSTRSAKNNLDLEYLTAIESSYFYLEQPTLFPLLLHENAHAYLGNNIFDSKDGDSPSEFQQSFERAVDGIEEFVDNLPPTVSVDPNLLPLLMEEVWADVIGIVIGKDAYLFALALTIFAADGNDHFESLSPRPLGIPLEDAISLSNRRLFAGPSLRLTSTFWTTRLRCCLILLNQLAPEEDNQYKNVPSFRKTLETSLDEWNQLTTAALGADKVGNDEFEMRQLEILTNAAITDICSVEFAELKSTFSKYEASKPNTDVPFVVSRRSSTKENTKQESSLISAIENGLEWFIKKQLSVSEFSGKNILPNILTLEQICPSIRWEVAKAVDIANKSNSKTPSSIQHFSEWQAHHRTDGSSAFRVSLEVVLLEKSIFESLTNTIFMIDDASREVSLAGDEELIAWAKELQPKLQGRYCEQIKEQVRDWINLRGYATENIVINAFGLTAENAVQVAKAIKIQGSRILLAAAKILTDSFFLEDRPTPIGIGLATIGLIKTSRFIEPKPDDISSRTLKDGLKKIVTETNFRKTNLKQTPFAPIYAKEQETNETTGATTFIRPLAGDYNFFAWQPGATPSELSTLQSEDSRAILKTRYVIHIQPISDKGKGKGKEKHNPIEANRPSILMLIKLRHRWHWQTKIKLLETKSESEGLGWQLLLSSSWEHVILTIQPKNFEYFEDLKKIPKLLDDLRLNAHEFGADVQTQIVGSEYQKNQNSINNTVLPNDKKKLSVTLYADALSKDFGATTNAITGRGDFQITWHPRKPKILKLDAFFEQAVLNLDPYISHQFSWVSHKLNWSHDSTNSEVTLQTTIGLRRKD
jgi:hypothetical protein